MAKVLKWEFLGLLTLLILAFISISPAYGHSGVSLSAWTSTSPTIDGTIGTVEWSPADTESFTIGSYSGVVYVMNDATNLYLAVKINDTTFGGSFDLARFFFDNDHDDIKLEHGDDIIGVKTGVLGIQDMFYNATGPYGPVITWDYTYSGTTDGLGNASGDGTYNYFELQHPLDSVDDLHDFSLSLGDTVGFCIQYYNGTAATIAYWPPGGYAGEDPWHDIVIASPPGPVPEFPLPLVAVVSMAAMILFVYRRKISRTLTR